MKSKESKLYNVIAHIQIFTETVWYTVYHCYKALLGLQYNYSAGHN